MLSTKKLLTKILKKTSGSYTYNSNNGTVKFEWTKCLFVTYVSLTIHTSTNWGIGSGNRITCTVDSNIPLPAGVANGTEINGIFVTIVGTTFRAQNNTGASLSGNSNFNPCMMYIAGGGTP